ncbi:hypothetical protein SAMN04488003_102180 [Loktanella fryxellensis]|uniref:Uncharacterized protein n=1 Tax=Loktanella fryxellensis TaxID=245187 RepID=A0A1H7ZX77_9RHOB|nr:hypothetical protein [Loktanella fryxellensis]SEM63080.1 hypothetical protein SAMN04488003_102180 [Loktanella fryxellensis]
MTSTTKGARIAFWRWVVLALGPAVGLVLAGWALQPLALNERASTMAFLEAIDTRDPIVLSEFFDTQRAQGPRLRVDQIMPIAALAIAVLLVWLIPRRASERATVNGLTTILAGMAISAVMVRGVSVYDPDAWKMFGVIVCSVTVIALARRIGAGRHSQS